jgi:tRNA-Thr(GGU) m(6)t(6)A37 methyltransferase TsaA
MQKFEFEPIGFIETPFKERFGTPRQPHLVPASWGVLRLRPELNLAEALDGLEGFSHIWLIFVFHQNTNKGIKAKIHPPRMGGEKTGLFATRTPHRPNPIGLSPVKLERIQGGILYLSGVDLVDGTPILDIKPYLPTADRLTHAQGGWTASRPERTLRVEFTTSALSDIDRLIGHEESALEARSTTQFKLAIEQILELDPRPNFYKGTETNPNPYTDVYGFRLDDFNIVYRMQEDLATVTGVEPWDDYIQRTKPAERR